MSEFHVRVVRIGEVQKHPNADTLSITQIDGGYPVIFRTGDFNEGDLAVYVPIDSVVPDTEQWAFLKGHRRIKAKKLRGIFSMGMLAPLPLLKKAPEVGENLQEIMGIEKYEPEVHAGKIMAADHLPSQDFMPKYTDIEGYRKNKDVFVEGEEVVLTEKIHGCNGRFLFRDGQLWVGSHNHLLEEGDSVWWNVARKYEDSFRWRPGILWYGEVYGPVQKGFSYGSPGETRLRVFDAFDTQTMRYLDYDEFETLALKVGLNLAPLLYRGPWKPELVSLAEGPTTITGPHGAHVREGWVGRPVRERFDRRVGRVILKMVGEGYLLSKDS